MSKEIMYFSAAWCGPCKAYKPELMKLVEEKSDQVKFTMIDIDQDREQVTILGIRGVPNAIILEDGVEVSRATGVPQIQEALAFLKT